MKNLKPNNVSTIFSYYSTRIIITMNTHFSKSLWPFMKLVLIFKKKNLNQKKTFFLSSLQKIKYNSLHKEIVFKIKNMTTMSFCQAKITSQKNKPTKKIDEKKASHEDCISISYCHVMRRKRNPPKNCCRENICVLLQSIFHPRKPNYYHGQRKNTIICDQKKCLEKCCYCCRICVQSLGSQKVCRDVAALFALLL